MPETEMRQRGSDDAAEGESHDKKDGWLCMRLPRWPEWKPPRLRQSEASGTFSSPANPGKRLWMLRDYDACDSPEELLNVADRGLRLLFVYEVAGALDLEDPNVRGLALERCLERGIT
jgi:hypothetical protein